MNSTSLSLLTTLSLVAITSNAMLRDPREVAHAIGVVASQVASHPHIQPQSVHEILAIKQLNRANATLTPRPFHEIILEQGPLVDGVKPLIRLVNMQPRICTDGKKVYKALAIINGQQRLLKTRYFSDNTLDVNYGINGIEYGPVISENYKISDDHDNNINE